MNSNFDRIRLRWRFDFHNKPSRFGQWSRPASRNEDMAAFQNAEGLLRASIEAQNVETNEIVTAAECDGHDFCNFQWVSAAFGFTGATAKIVGLAMSTSDEICTVYVDGSTSCKERSDDDKKYHYATYGR